MDKTAPEVTITHHPDVRRSLMTQKAYAEGMRALVLRKIVRDQGQALTGLDVIDLDEAAF
jgi:alkylation response protein AidB-like acyl-CoA dehydrogenase